MPHYQIYQISTDICVAEYDSDIPVSRSDIDPIYGSDDYETRENGEYVDSPVSYVWVQFDFLKRFTIQERIAIRAAGNTDPVVYDALKLLEATQKIHSNSQDVLQTLGYFQQQGLLTNERRLEILGQS